MLFVRLSWTNGHAYIGPFYVVICVYTILCIWVAFVFIQGSIVVNVDATDLFDSYEDTDFDGRWDPKKTSSKQTYFSRTITLRLVAIKQLRQ